MLELDFVSAVGAWLFLKNILVVAPRTKRLEIQGSYTTVSKILTNFHHFSQVFIITLGTCKTSQRYTDRRNQFTEEKRYKWRQFSLSFFYIFILFFYILTKNRYVHASVVITTLLFFLLKYLQIYKMTLNNQFSLNIFCTLPRLW